MDRFDIIPEDIEPLDASERCDQAYGNYHIGREDETREELALFFDTQWLPDPSFLDCGLWSIINPYGGRLMTLSEYCPGEEAALELLELLGPNFCVARSPEVAAEVALTVAVVELTKPPIEAVHTKLRAYTSYIGYGIVSWPSHFRSIITSRQVYV